MTAATKARPYPLSIDIAYPESQARLPALARLPLGLPALVFSLLLNIGAALPTWAAILASGRVPSWLFAFQVRVSRWHTQTAAYLLLLNEHYPTLNGDHPITYTIANPEAASRWKLVIWKTVTSIPHLLVLIALTVALVPITLAAWIAVVATGRYPRALHHYAAGTVRWYARVFAYLQSLTDEFPPFSLSAAAGPSTRGAYWISAGIGVILTSPFSAFAAFLVYIIGFTGTHVARDVPYDNLQQGLVISAQTTATVESGRMQLISVSDPADDELELFRPPTGSRYITFTISIENWRGAGETVDVAPSSFQLEDSSGLLRAPVLVGLDGAPGPGPIPSHATGVGVVVFEIADNRNPKTLVWDVVDYIDFPRRGETIEWNFT